MISWTLYKYEMKRSVKLLAAFAVILAIYVSIIITMYDPKMMAMLESFATLMPELMAAVGMDTGVTSLLGFMISYLYGFILLVFPMVYCIIRGNDLIARYVDRGSMVCLTAAPVKRRTIALTQMLVLLSGVVFLILFVTILEVIVAGCTFPGELDYIQILKVNAGLLCLHFFVGGICFLASCACSNVKYSLGFGAGIPVVMYILQMISNLGKAAKNARYFTFFTLFQPNGIMAGKMNAIAGVIVLLVGAGVLFFAGTTVFAKKDLHI